MNRFSGLLFVFLFTCTNLFAQQKQLSDWQQMDSLAKQKFWKEIPPVLNRLDKKSKQSDEKLRIFLIRTFLEEKLSDQPDKNQLAIKNIKHKIALIKDKTQKAILNVYLAKAYFYYYLPNAYKIDQRSTTDSTIAKSEDVDYWTNKDFAKTIDLLYQNILSQKELLSRQTTSRWDDLLSNTKSEITPTLYDVAVNDYIQYLHHASSRGFYYSSEKIKAIKNELYQSLADLHKNKNTDAYIYNLYQLESLKTGMNRLKIVRQMESWVSMYPDLKNKNFYISEIVNEKFRTIYFDSKNQQPVDSLKLLIEKYKTDADSNLMNYLTSRLAEINNPVFRVELSKTNTSRQPLLLAVTHKNTPHINYIIVQKTDIFDISEDDFYSSKNPFSEIQNYLRQNKLVTSGTLPVQSFKDNLNHQTLLDLPALPAGTYMIFFTTAEDFNQNHANAFYYSAAFNVSSYHYFNKNNAYYFVDRISGQPLAHTTVTTYENRSKKLHKTNTYQTDKNGLLYFSDKQNPLFFSVEDEKVLVRSNLNRNNIFGNQPIKNKKNWGSVIFTDRKIYRPGQLVYFKSIVYQSEDRKNYKAAADTKVNLTLFDANDKEIERKELTTNKFGSVSGSFVLPQGKKNGEYSIQITNDNFRSVSTLNVEEYKRPTFEILLDKYTEKKSLGDSITVTGQLKSFAGASLGNAKISMLVDQQRLFYYGRNEQNSNYKVNYFSDTLYTDQNGKFKMTFPTEKKAKTAKRFNETTDIYQINITASDITGETHTTNTQIALSDKPYYFDITNFASSGLNMDSIVVFAKNRMDEKQVVKGKLLLYKIEKKPVNEYPLDKTPTTTQHINKTIYYESLPKTDFKQKFPFYNYLDTSANKIISEKLLLSIDFTTGKDTSYLKIPKEMQQSGDYKFVAISVENNDTIQTNYETTVRKNIKKPVAFSVQFDKKSYQIGETAKITISSSFNNVFYNLDDLNFSDTTERFIELSKSPILVKVNHENQILNLTTFKNEQNFNHFVPIPVIETKDQIFIKTNTFRSKLIPGAKEKWSFQIVGNKKEKYTAEMIANMYDASLDHLDQVEKNQFSIRLLRNNFNSYQTWQTENLNIQSYSNFLSLDLNVKNYFIENPFLSSFLSAYDLIFTPLKIQAVDGIFTSMENYPTTRIRGAGIQSKSLSESNGILEEVVVTADGLGRSAAKQVEELSDSESDTPALANEPAIPLRRNLQETAFFLPQLHTDKEGNISFTFDSPESLTKWRFMAFAHTTDLLTAKIDKEVITQKEIMVTPNFPRFFREGDRIELKFKVDNLSKTTQRIKVNLQMFDAISEQPFSNNFEEKITSVDSGSNQMVSWSLEVPKNLQALTYRITAASDQFSDGEESQIPVLSNQQLITESVAMSIRENQSKTYTLPNLKELSKTATPYQFTVQMTSNPVYDAIFALPSVSNTTTENADALSNRLYATLMTNHLLTSQPQIKNVFSNWKSNHQLTSKINQNEEFKQVILEETPWVQFAQNEAQNKQDLTKLFDKNYVSSIEESIITKLVNLQNNDGSFSWFPGSRGHQYITQNILTGLQKLIDQNAFYQETSKTAAQNMYKAGIGYLTKEVKTNYENYKAGKRTNLPLEVDYWFLVSSNKTEFEKTDKDLLNTYIQLLDAAKMNMSLMQQAKTVLILYRAGKENSAQLILKQWQQTSIDSENKGMYWDNNSASWFWSYDPIQTQAAMIEAINEISHDQQTIDKMKMWLMWKKQVSHWGNPNATIAAVDALMKGENWLKSDMTNGMAVRVGNQKLDIAKLEKQAGSGFFKETWFKSDIKPAMATISVEKKSSGWSYGGAYYQYFENLDQVKDAASNIQLTKELYLRRIVDKQPVLTRITDQMPIKTGDEVVVRILIKTDRDLSFMHLKDMRASGLEPTDVISEYKWQQGFGYYQSVKDASTNFYIDYLPQGSFVFEYTLRANNAGTFSNGITTLQNYYAPEMSAHSKGQQLTIF